MHLGRRQTHNRRFYVTDPSTTMSGMSDTIEEPLTTLLFSAILITFGTVASVVLDSWVFAVLFIVMAVAWIVRLVAEVRDKYK